MTKTGQSTGSAETSILANRNAAKQAAAELLTAAAHGQLVVTLPDGDRAVVCRAAEDGTYARLTDEHVRLAIALAAGTYPLLRARQMTRPRQLAGSEDIGTHHLETTADGEAAQRNPTAMYLPPVYQIRAVQLLRSALVR